MLELSVWYKGHTYLGPETPRRSPTEANQIKIILLEIAHVTVGIQVDAIKYSTMHSFNNGVMPYKCIYDATSY